jgi:hypothetical protein
MILCWPSLRPVRGTQRDHQAAAALELAQQGLRQVVDRLLDDDRIVGPVLRPAVVAVAGEHIDIAVAEVLEQARGVVGQRLDHLDAVDACRELGEHRGVVAFAGAGLEHHIVRLHLGEVGH